MEDKISIKNCSIEKLVINFYKKQIKNILNNRITNKINTNLYKYSSFDICSNANNLLDKENSLSIFKKKASLCLNNYYNKRIKEKSKLKINKNITNINVNNNILTNNDDNLNSINISYEVNEIFDEDYTDNLNSASKLSCNSYDSNAYSKNYSNRDECHESNLKPDLYNKIYIIEIFLNNKNKNYLIERWIFEYNFKDFYDIFKKKTLKSNFINYFKTKLSNLNSLFELFIRIFPSYSIYKKANEILDYKIFTNNDLKSQFPNYNNYVKDSKVDYEIYFKEIDIICDKIFNVCVEYIDSSLIAYIVNSNKGITSNELISDKFNNDNFYNKRDTIDINNNKNVNSIINNQLKVYKRNRFLSEDNTLHPSFQVVNLYNMILKDDYINNSNNKKDSDKLNSLTRCNYNNITNENVDNLGFNNTYTLKEMNDNKKLNNNNSRKELNINNCYNEITFNNIYKINNGSNNTNTNIFKKTRSNTNIINKHTILKLTEKTNSRKSTEMKSNLLSNSKEDNNINNKNNSKQSNTNIVKSDNQILNNPKSVSKIDCNDSSYEISFEECELSSITKPNKHIDDNNIVFESAYEYLDYNNIDKKHDKKEISNNNNKFNLIEIVNNKENLKNILDKEA